LKRRASPACEPVSKEAREGGIPDRRDEVVERLRQGPGESVGEEVRQGPAGEAPEIAGASPSGPPPSRWTVGLIRASFDWMADVSESGVRRRLRRWGLRLRASSVQQWSPDAEYKSKLHRLVSCLQEVREAPTTAALVFLDEMSYHCWPEPGRDWGPSAPEAPPLPRRATEKTLVPNNSQWRIIGALNPLNGRVSYTDGYIVGRAKVAEFYRQLDLDYTTMDRLYVVQDNWSIHSHPDVVAACQALPRLRPIFLPTYSPWLNPIEKLWRWLRQDVLKLHRLLEEWKAVRERVRYFLNQFAGGSQALLRYVGLLGNGRLACALRAP
jgi:transposase